MKCLQDCLCCIRCGLWCNVMTSENYNINGEQHDLSYWSYGTAHWHRTMSNIRLYFMIELIDFYWLITDQSSLMRHHKHRAISPHNILSSEPAVVAVCCLSVRPLHHSSLSVARAAWLTASRRAAAAPSLSSLLSDPARSSSLEQISAAQPVDSSWPHLVTRNSAKNKTLSQWSNYVGNFRTRFCFRKQSQLYRGLSDEFAEEKWDSKPD